MRVPVFIYENGKSGINGPPTNCIYELTVEVDTLVSGSCEDNYVIIDITWRNTAGMLNRSAVYTTTQERREHLAMRIQRFWKHGNR